MMFFFWDTRTQVRMGIPNVVNIRTLCPVIFYRHHPWVKVQHRPRTHTEEVLLKLTNNSAPGSGCIKDSQPTSHRHGNK